MKMNFYQQLKNLLSSPKNMNSLLGNIAIPQEGSPDERAQIVANAIIEKSQGIGLNLSYDDAKAIASNLIANELTYFDYLVEKHIKKGRDPLLAKKFAKEDMAIHQFVGSMNLLKA